MIDINELSKEKITKKRTCFLNILKNFNKIKLINKLNNYCYYDT